MNNILYFYFYSWRSKKIIIQLLVKVKVRSYLLSGQTKVNFANWQIMKILHKSVLGFHFLMHPHQTDPIINSSKSISAGSSSPNISASMHRSRFQHFSASSVFSLLQLSFLQRLRYSLHTIHHQHTHFARENSTSPNAHRF